MEDIIVTGQNFFDHLNKLRQVIERLRQANLKLKAKKCKFFQKEVTFLGHVVSDNGVKTDPVKTRVVEE